MTPTRSILATLTLTFGLLATTAVSTSQSAGLAGDRAQEADLPLLIARLLSADDAYFRKTGQLEQLRTLAVVSGDADRVQQVEALMERLELIHEQRIADLGEEFGQDTLRRAQADAREIRRLDTGSVGTKTKREWPVGKRRDDSGSGDTAGGKRDTNEGAERGWPIGRDAKRKRDSSDGKVTDEKRKRDSGDGKVTDEKRKRDSGDGKVTDEKRKRDSGDGNVTGEKRKRDSSDGKVTDEKRKRDSGDGNVTGEKRKRDSGGGNVTGEKRKRDSGGGNVGGGRGTGDDDDRDDDDDRSKDDDESGDEESGDDDEIDRDRREGGDGHRGRGRGKRERGGRSRGDDRWGGANREDWKVERKHDRAMRKIDREYERERAKLERERDREVDRALREGKLDKAEQIERKFERKLDELEWRRAEKEAHRMAWYDEHSLVTICWYPPGNPDARHTKRVGRAAVEHFLDMGATLGPCDVDSSVTARPRTPVLRRSAGAPGSSDVTDDRGIIIDQRGTRVPARDPREILEEVLRRVPDLPPILKPSDVFKIGGESVTSDNSEDLLRQLAQDLDREWSAIDAEKADGSGDQ